jgi:hypothetical protein
VRSVLIPAYHRQMIERAANARARVPPDERDVSALTVCIQGRSLADLKARIHRFREEMLERCDSEERPEQVYQLCIQLFPLSKPPPGSWKDLTGGWELIRAVETPSWQSPDCHTRDLGPLAPM